MKKQKVLVVVLMFALLFNAKTIGVSAEGNERQLEVGDIVEEGVMPMWNYTSSITQSFTIDQITGYTQCDASILGYSDVKKISAYMYLEKRNGNSTYVVTKKWHEITDSFSLNLHGATFLAARGTYRIHGEYYVYNKDGYCEMITVYTNEKMWL